MPRLFLSIGPDDTGLAVARPFQGGDLDLALTAVSRAPHGPALESDLFDDVWTVPSWDQLDPTDHADELNAHLGPETWYLPSSLEETHWLASHFSSHASVLSPTPSALRTTTGPDPAAVEDLPVSVPDWIRLSAPVEDLHAFGRQHGWSLWMRSFLGNRQPLSHWTEFASRRAEMLAQDADHGSPVLQRQVNGTPLTVPFAAHEGRLLGAALVRPVADRRDTYRVTPLPSALRSTLEDALCSLGWTGGGALNLIEDEEETRWFDAWRPCFGTAVEGVAHCGLNLPARLLAAHTETSLPATEATPSTFTRTAIARPGTTSAPSSQQAPNRTASPSPPVPPRTLPALSTAAAELTPALHAVIDDLPPDWASTDTPRPVLLPTRTQERFKAFTDAADRLEAAFDLDAARVGLSIKTNPADRLLATARETGMLAETIHPAEMAHARRHGYATDEIIVNGPVQARLPNLDAAPYALFGDAITDLATLPFDPGGAIVGVRTRPPERGASRFGVDLSEPDRMQRLCDRLTDLPAPTRIGLHLHAPSSTLGHSRWWAGLDRVLAWAKTIQERTGRPVACLDLGGGWHPDDWLDVFVPGLLERCAHIQSALPDLNTLLLEPGKALSQPLGVVLSRVIDVRPTRDEVILDASIAELSNIDYHPHRLLAHTEDQGWHRLPRGTGRLLGRLCMEADVLGHRRKVDRLSPGDTVAICDAGAYDASMTYPFGQGRTAVRDAPPSR